MEHDSEVSRFRVGEHDELDLRRSLVVVKLVLSSTVGYEADRIVSHYFDSL